jgi:hypothetical protein
MSKIMSEKLFYMQAMAEECKHNTQKVRELLGLV